MSHVCLHQTFDYGRDEEAFEELLDRALCAALRICDADTAHCGTRSLNNWRRPGRARDGRPTAENFALEKLASFSARFYQSVTNDALRGGLRPEETLRLGPVIGTPILRNGVSVGSLLVSRHPGSPPFQESDMDRLQALADGVAAGYRPGGCLDLQAPPIWPGARTASVPVPAIVKSAKMKSESPIIREFLPGYVFASESMRGVRERCLELSAKDCPVLILGPTGSGKEGIAAFIHARSNRAGKSMVDEDLSTFAESLFETSMRGHLEGAYTDAKVSRAGLLESADKSDLFLDEIQNLPPAVQKKLLRLLEKKHVRRIGGTKEFAADFRLIAASNEDLRTLVKAGKFREDLYRRLRVGVVKLPALAERREDILPIARAWLASHYPNHRLDAGAEAWLLAQPWPGNVRELVNLLEACAVPTETWITAEMLAEEAAADGLEELPDEYPGLDARIAEFTRNEVVQAVACAKGNTAEAARILKRPERTTRELRRMCGLPGVRGRKSPNCGEKPPKVEE